MVLDFGLALDASGADLTLTRSGERIGTPKYMSPEQITGNSREVDARTDVYSLGVTLYEALTARAPFVGDDRESVFRAVTRGDTTPANRLNAHISRDLQLVLGGWLPTRVTRCPRRGPHARRPCTDAAWAAASIGARSASSRLECLPCAPSPPAPSPSLQPCCCRPASRAPLCPSPLRRRRLALALCCKRGAHR
ncbi:MAG: hypothetical protein DRQ55_07180 [Planctomycetota bacterium]|nr:MAG: hypothetical protein DRQ55_07180 [Planctomycetota bacterium]